ncbi:MAG: winged helix-turn-helix domain-containing protein [Chloroflexi bacterium]|mgnify:CR=1 FL=1|nr:winged helix-turn-helix domain-containing protein [Chloroflexota bacterium]
MLGTFSLTKTQAQQLMLACLGLLKKPPKKATKLDLLSNIRQIHNLQLDTISVVARAHLHILWSRLGDFDPTWLEELHAEGQLFEYFSHGVSLMPIEDYPLSRALMIKKFMGWGNIRDWGEKNQQVLTNILEHIHANGEVRSADFERKQSRGKWWDWKIEKIALEHLYYRGDLMISRREKFQRVYDLRERVLPTWYDSQAPSYEEAVKALAGNAVKALGVANATWAANYFYLKKAEAAIALEQLVTERLVFAVDVEGLKGSPFYVHSDNLNLLDQAIEGVLRPIHTSILSPFDPLISDRGRATDLFDFDYRIECYTPSPKRIYGYFVLPILRKGKMVGRLDAKAWRKENRLQVIRIYLEPGVRLGASLVKDLASTLKTYAAWQGLQSVEIDWAQPDQLRNVLQGELSR